MLATQHNETIKTYTTIRTMAYFRYQILDFPLECNMPSGSLSPLWMMNEILSKHFIITDADAPLEVGITN